MYVSENLYKSFEVFIFILNKAECPETITWQILIRYGHIMYRKLCNDDVYMYVSEHHIFPMMFLLKIPFRDYAIDQCYKTCIDFRTNWSTNYVFKSFSNRFYDESHHC